jgi:hypothetical protein
LAVSLRCGRVQPGALAQSRRAPGVTIETTDGHESTS